MILTLRDVNNNFMALLNELKPIQDRIKQAKRATRDDIAEALALIRAQGAVVDLQLSELVSVIYTQEQIDKLLSSIPSYS